MTDIEKELGKAVAHFWRTLERQHENQGGATGQKDAGNRGAVTGGKHADGFISVIASICRGAGLTDAHIFSTEKKPRTLPEFFRPAKEWDIVVRHESDGFVKRPESRHPGESRGPEVPVIPGFRLSPE